MRCAHLHANASLAHRHDRVGKADYVDAALEKPVGELCRERSVAENLDFLATIQGLDRRQARPRIEKQNACTALVDGANRNLAGKRARINGTDTVRGEILVKAQVPLAELEGYAAELKSMTAGRGRYSLDFSHYEPVPPAVQQKLMEAYRPRHDED